MNLFKKLGSKIKEQYGQAALIMVLVVITVMLVIVASVGLLTYNDLRTIGNVVDSSQSYYAAESGAEDALIRIYNRNYPSGTYSFAVGTGSTEVTVSGPITALDVISKGNVNNRFRKVEVGLSATPNSNNIGFNYGVQVGYGGFYMLNNSTLNGSVYSNGPISGSSSNLARITVDAFSANTPAANADQSNSSPTPAPNSIIFGNNNSTQDLAQSFQVSTTEAVNKVQLYINRTASTPASATVRIVNDNSGSPGTTTIASGTLNASSVGTSPDWIDVAMDNNPQLNSGVTYWLVVDASSHASKYYTIGANSAYASGQAKLGQYSGGPWSATSPAGLDAYFTIYLGGVKGSIDGVYVGYGGTGNAHAYSVTNTNITGTNYCQVGSGNNVTCDTSQADPPSQNLPVSSANITQWKAEASSGGTITGDYTPPGTSSSFGPKEITGNLIIPVGYTLTLTGTVWVHGTITSGSGATFNLDSLYGSSGGVLLADGSIDLGNNNTFNGSGQATSYYLVLTTNDCDGTLSPTGATCTASNSALDVSNNVGSVVLYSTNGQIHLKNGAAAKQVTGWRMLLDQNASINYDTGLASTVFSSGPGGGFKINSWREIE